MMSLENPFLADAVTPAKCGICNVRLLPNGTCVDRGAAWPLEDATGRNDGSADSLVISKELAVHYREELRSQMTRGDGGRPLEADESVKRLACLRRGLSITPSQG